MPWQRWSAPRYMAVVTILTTLLLMSEFISPSTRPSAPIISLSNILSRKSSTIISMILPWKWNDAPWAMAAIKKEMLLFLISALLSCSASPRSLTVFVSNKSSRKLSVKFSASIKAFHKSQLRLSMHRYRTYRKYCIFCTARTPGTVPASPLD